MRAGWGGFEHRDRISTYGEYYGSKEEACGGTFEGFLELSADAPTAAGEETRTSSSPERAVSRRPCPPFDDTV